MQLTQSTPAVAANPVTTKISTADVKSMAGKLEKLAHELPDQEQAILGWMLHRAESCTNGDLAAASALADDFAGPSTPMARQLANSVGLANQYEDDNIDVTVEVKWTYRF